MEESRSRWQKNQPPFLFYIRVNKVNVSQPWKAAGYAETPLPNAFVLLALVIKRLI